MSEYFPSSSTLNEEKNKATFEVKVGNSDTPQQERIRMSNEVAYLATTISVTANALNNVNLSNRSINISGSNINSNIITGDVSGNVISYINGERNATSNVENRNLEPDVLNNPEKYKELNEQGYNQELKSLNNEYISLQEEMATRLKNIQERAKEAKLQKERFDQQLDNLTLNKEQDQPLPRSNDARIMSKSNNLPLIINQEVQEKLLTEASENELREELSKRNMYTDPVTGKEHSNDRKRDQIKNMVRKFRAMAYEKIHQATAPKEAVSKLPDEAYDEEEYENDYVPQIEPNKEYEGLISGDRRGVKNNEQKNNNSDTLNLKLNNLIEELGDKEYNLNDYLDKSSQTAYAAKERYEEMEDGDAKDNLKNEYEGFITRVEEQKALLEQEIQEAKVKIEQIKSELKNNELTANSTIQNQNETIEQIADEPIPISEEVKTDPTLEQNSKIEEVQAAIHPKTESNPTEYEKSIQSQDDFMKDRINSLDSLNTVTDLEKEIERIQNGEIELPDLIANEGDYDDENIEKIAENQAYQNERMVNIFKMTVILQALKQKKTLLSQEFNPINFANDEGMIYSSRTFDIINQDGKMVAIIKSGRDKGDLIPASIDEFGRLNIVGETSGNYKVIDFEKKLKDIKLAEIKSNMEKQFKQGII
jgi:hypothetical protein